MCGMAWAAAQHVQVTLWKESLEGKWHQVADVLDKQ